MQNELINSIPVVAVRKSLTLHELLLKPVEKLKLQLRAEKYRYREDPGGIAYILQKIKNDDIVFDIGAHKAGYLYYFLEKAGHTGKIFAFEPQSVLHNYLKKLQQLFSWENVTIESFAITDRPGTALLCVPYNHGKPSSPCATIIESEMNFNFQYTEEVRTISIDEYCSKHNLKPTFLKVDVEGNELLVFKGAEQTLRKHKPKILFECEKRFVGEKRLIETFHFLKQLGYSGYFISGKERKPISIFNTATHQNLSGTPYCNNFIFE